MFFFLFVSVKLFLGVLNRCYVAVHHENKVVCVYWDVFANVRGLGRYRHLRTSDAANIRFQYLSAL